MLQRVVLVAVALVAGLPGCSDDNGVEPLSVSVQIENVPPGVENTQCVQVRLGNDGPLDVAKMVNTISSSSHHFVVSTVAEPDAEEILEPFDCRPFRAPLMGVPLIISQRKTDVHELPEGVAFKLADNQLIHLELHYINTTSEPVDITATAEFFPAPEDSAVQEASVLLVGSTDIQIPPMSEHTLGPLYQPLPEEYRDVSFYALTGHTHQYGVDVKVATATSETATTTSRYAFDDYKWDEPELLFHEPPFAVGDGGFSYSCSWRNTTSDTIGFGESANEEMCFFWAYYYPRKPGRGVLLHGR